MFCSCRPISICRSLNAFARSTPRCAAADDVIKASAGILGIQFNCYAKTPSGNLETGACHSQNLQQFLTSVIPASILSSSKHTCPGLYIPHVLHYSTGVQPKTTSKLDETKQEDLSVFQRFRRSYKEHGKVLLTVHTTTAVVWYSMFYMAVRCGVDVVPLLEQLGASERVVQPFRAGGLGDYAMAYLIYKLASPLRYTVTLAGTNFVIRRLRIKGRMAPKSQEDSLKELYLEGKRKLKKSTIRKETKP